MTYREMPTRTIEGHVVHGPFPIRWTALIFMVMGLALGLLAMFYVLASDSLVCPAAGPSVRSEGARPSVRSEGARPCVLTSRRPPLDATTFVFARGELTGEGNVRSENVVGSKGHVSGHVILHSDRRADRVLLSTSPEEAARIANEANLALTSGRDVSFTIRNSPVMGVVALGLYAVFLWAAYAHFVNAGRFRLVVVRGGVALRVGRAIFGVPITSREVPLEGVEDVRVDATEVNDFWTPKGVKTAMGRLVLVDRNGTPTPLTRTFHTGQTLHYRAAAELRVILGLEPKRGGVEETLEKMQLVVTPAGSRFGFAWLGTCVGFLLGPLLALGFGMLTGLMERRSGGEIDSAWFLSGAALGACAGIVIALHATRPRLPD